MATVLLIGSFGRGNLGDDVLLLSSYQLFRHHTIYINTASDAKLPSDINGKVSLLPTSPYKGMISKMFAFFKSKAIVYCGGDVWVQLYGDRFPHKSLYMMIAVNVLARFFGKRVYYLGCGAGELRGRSYGLARFSARLANGVITRDQESAHLLGLPGIMLAPDLSIVATSRLKIASEINPSGQFTIGVSILWYVHEPHKNFGKLVEMLEYSLRANSTKDTRIIIFPLLISRSATHDDQWAAEQLLSKLAGLNVEIFSGRTLEDFLSAIYKLDLMIGTRLHANIIAAYAGIPCVGISYRPKVKRFFVENDLARYCVDIGQNHQLSSVIKSVISDYANVQQNFALVRSNNAQRADVYRKLSHEIVHA
jgi:polysaccharide pyruvyl transferase WcaK-like protein